MGSDKIVFCANVNMALQAGAGVKFVISRRVSRQWRRVMQFLDTQAPYCVVQDDGRKDDLRVSYEEIEPPLGSGTYRVVARVVGADGTMTPKYVQEIRIRG